MALRARLVAPPPPPKTVWPWHTVKSGSIPYLPYWGVIGVWKRRPTFPPAMNPHGD